MNNKYFAIITFYQFKIIKDKNDIITKLKDFWKLKLIRYPQDIFRLDYNRIENLEGWGKLSVENLKYSINEKKIYH